MNKGRKAGADLAKITFDDNIITALVVAVGRTILGWLPGCGSVEERVWRKVEESGGKGVIVWRKVEERV